MIDQCIILLTNFLNLVTIWLAFFLRLNHFLPEVIGQIYPKYLSYDDSQLLQALVFGRAKLLSSSQRHLFEIIGMQYLLSASGFHVVFFARFLVAPLGSWLSPKHKSWGELLLATFFVAGAGWPVAALRTLVAMSLRSLAKFVWQRQITAWWLVIVSTTLVVFIHPKWVSDVGLQLSFTAALGVNLLTNRYKRFWLKVCNCETFSKTHSKASGQSWRSYVISSLAGTLGALSLSWPLVIHYFHSFSLLSPLSNLVLMWLIPVIAMTSYLILVSHLVTQFLPACFAVIPLIEGQVLSHLLELFSSIATQLGQYPATQLQIQTLPLLLAVAWYGYIFGRLRKKLV